MSTLADFKKEIKKPGTGEGNIAHMYLDTVGKVTVGVGNMLPDVAAAKRLAFVVRATKKKATGSEIEADFNSVKKQSKGRIASSYKNHTKLDLPATAIDKLLDARIAEFTTLLRAKFVKFSSFPVPAQLALLDMAFNLGVTGLMTKFPNMRKAVEAKNWATAAKESNRPQVSKGRNDLVKKWFNEAAKK